MAYLAWTLKLVAASAISYLSGLLFDVPSKPRFVPASVWRAVYDVGVFHGFTISSFFWIALIVFALIVRKNK